MRAIYVGAHEEIAVIEPSTNTFSGLPRKGVVFLNTTEKGTHIVVDETDGELLIGLVTAKDADELNGIKEPEEYGRDTV